jgi:hypothetical protein
MEAHLTPFLDAIEVKYGPKVEIGRFILETAEKARCLGIRLYMCKGFDRLLKVNQENIDTWDHLAPTYDPRISNITCDNAIYIEGQHNSQPVLTVALRRYDWPETSLATEWESGRFAYRDPDRQMKPGERWVAGAPIAAQIRGRAVFAGGVWCRPDFRGRRVPVLTAALMRSVSLTVWNPDFMFGMFATGPASRAMLWLHGNPPSQPGMLVEGAWRSFDSTVTWETREDLRDRIMPLIQHGRSARKNGTEDTKTSVDFVLQGNTSLS